MLELKRTTDYGKSFKTVAKKIYSFGLGGKFLFASVMTGKVSVLLCIVRYKKPGPPSPRSVCPAPFIVTDCSFL